ncbi:MAG: MopE-related protein, partial [Myxococcota bacterium]
MKLSYACFVALTLALAGCKASVSTVIEERNDDTPTDNSNNGSRNGSGNGNSNNNANSNNNNSGAECVDGAMEPCGSDVGQCMAGERTCTDGLWGACIGEVAPVTETCNGLDDNCDGTPDEGCPCTGDETRACGTDVGECQAGTQTCNAGAWGDCMGAVDPVLELCNDLDDNCDGTDDDGCDDDGDGYCDAAIMVMGSPGICPNGGNDCDDSVATGATVNPGATEVCTDGIDNDCLGGADRADLASCAPPSLNIDRGEAIDLNHSNTIVLTADFDFEDPGFGTPSEWTREWEIVSVAGGCVASDATLQDGVEFASLTRVTFVPPSSVGTLGCVFTVRATVAGVAFDQIDIRVVNDRPMISSIDEAVFDGASWRMQVRVNTSRSVTARWQLPEADVPVIFDWTGAGASVLGCSSSSCENSVGAQPFFSTQTINAPSTTGSVIINVSVRDSFEAVSDTVPLIIEFIDCVWVADTGTAGTGLTPSSPLNDLDAAITAAFSASPPDDVCIVGGGTLAKDGTPLPTSPSSTPSIFAGFDSTGAVTANRPTITVGTPDGLTFSAGYSGTIAGVTLESTYSASLPPAVVTVRDSSPTLIDTDVVVPTADGSTGIDINASGTANPEIIGGDIRPESSGMAPTNTTGIRVRESSGEAAPILSPEQVDIRGVEGTIARAIWLEEGTTATVSNTSLIFAGGNVTTAVAIDVDGGASSTSAVIADNASIRTFGGSVTETSVIIRLSNTNRVMIRGNTLQGPFSEISGFNAAIADGSLDRQGNLVPGNSTLLTIEDNDEIGLGGPFSIDCSGTGETMDVSSAIFLAGTSNATVRNNQNIRGGSGSAHWSPAGRVYPPLNVGLWTTVTPSASMVHR